MRLTKTFAPEAYRQALQSWSWLGIGDKTPVLATPFGDVFLEDADGLWFLDTIEGAIKRVAGSRDELRELLNTGEGQDEYLLAGLAIALDGDGVQLGEHEVYDFTIPPALGGKIEKANVTKMDFIVAVDLAGQLHEQIRNLPPGTKIKGFKTAE